jgi:hypothetical protein
MNLESDSASLKPRLQPAGISPHPSKARQRLSHLIGRLLVRLWLRQNASVSAKQLTDEKKPT